MARRIGRRRTALEIQRARARALTARKAHLKKMHRMTLEEYESLKSFQGGLCPLCLRANGKSKALAVEHDHAIAREACDHPVNESCRNCWRGLCCATCNKILGHARDDVMFAWRMIDYLTNPPARRWHGEPLKMMKRPDESSSS